MPGPWSWTDLLRFDQSLDQVVRCIQSAEQGVDVQLLTKQAKGSAGPFQAAGFKFSQLLDVRLRRILLRLSPDEVRLLIRRLSVLAAETKPSSNEPDSSDLPLWLNTLKRGLLVRIRAELTVAMQPWCRGAFSSGDLAASEEVARAWNGMIATAGAYAALLHEAGFVDAEIATRRRVAYGLVHLVLGRIPESERVRLFSRLPTDALLAFQTAKLPRAFHTALAAQPGEVARGEQQSQQIGIEVAAELSRRFQQQLSRITDLLDDFASEPEVSTAAALQLLADLQELWQQIKSSSGPDRSTLLERVGTAWLCAAMGWCRLQAEHPDVLKELSCRELRRLQDHLRAIEVTALDDKIAGVLTERFHQSQIALESNLATVLEAVTVADAVAATSAAHGLAVQLALFEDLASPAAQGSEADIVSRGMSAREVLRRTLIGLNQSTEQLQRLARQLESPAMQLARDVLQHAAAKTRAHAPERSDTLYRSWLIFSELADAFDDVLAAEAVDMIPMLERPDRCRKFTTFPAEFHGVLRDLYGVTVDPDG